MRVRWAVGPPCRLSDQVFFVMGSPQQLTVPFSEPLVTTNSEPHVPQEYRFPVSLAKSHTSLIHPRYEDYIHATQERQRPGPPSDPPDGRAIRAGLGHSSWARG